MRCFDFLDFGGESGANVREARGLFCGCDFGGVGAEARDGAAVGETAVCVVRLPVVG